MAFVPQYKHDIFVSYAHVDDNPPFGADEGWVTTLVGRLEALLSQILGRSDAFSLWMDRHRLSGHVHITTEVVNTLRESATLLIILSPAYIASEWCRLERDKYLKVIEEWVDSGSRVFVVEREEVEYNDRPPEFRELLGYRFWVEDGKRRSPRILGVPKPDPSDPRYYDVLYDLAHDLAEKLKRLKAHAVVPKIQIEYPASEKTPTSDSQIAVFLAEVSDDLAVLRDGVERYLEQAGLRVLPERRYSRDPTAFQAAVDRDLAKCRVFVQLLSGVAGEKSLKLPQGRVGLQFECAVKMGIPILQWRSRDVEVATLTDLDHIALLQGSEVRAVGIEEFKREIIERALHRPEMTAPRPIDTFVFVNMDMLDRSLADAVCTVADRYGVGYALPLRDGTPAEVRTGLEENLRCCNGLIIIYGHITVTWVQQQLLYCRKIISRRDHPLELAVYEGPPIEKAPLLDRMRKMRIIDGRNGLNELELHRFLDSMKKNADRNS